MDPALKNLREWVALLFVLFLALDVAGFQYGTRLVQSAPLSPGGGLIAMAQGSRGGYYNVYITPTELGVYCGLLGTAALALLATLTLIVVHGIRRLRPRRAAIRPRNGRKRHSSGPRSG